MVGDGGRMANGGGRVADGSASGEKRSALSMAKEPHIIIIYVESLHFIKGTIGFAQAVTMKGG